MSDNVVLFPKIKRDSPPQTIEEIADKISQTRKDHVENLMYDMAPDIVNLLGSYGLDVTDPDNIKDTAMVMESIKSMVCRQYNIDHSFHKMVDTIFDFNYNDDSTVSYTYKFPVDEE